MSLNSLEHCQQWISEHCGPPEKAESLCYFVIANFVYFEYFAAAKRERIEPLPYKQFAGALKAVFPELKEGPVGLQNRICFYPISFYRDFKGGYLMTG